MSRIALSMESHTLWKHGFRSCSWAGPNVCSDKDWAQKRLEEGNLIERFTTLAAAVKGTSAEETQDSAARNKK